MSVWAATSIKGVRQKTGTSHATPFATAAAAILMAGDPAMTPAEARARLRDMTRDLGAAGEDDVFGVGLLTLDRLCTPPLPPG